MRPSAAGAEYFSARRATPEQTQPKRREALELHVERAAGHHEVAAGLKAADPVVHGTPVGYDRAVKAPVGAEDVGEQRLVVRAVHAVHGVVGAHDGGGPPLAYGDLKAAEVQLPERAIVHDAVGGKALVLLAVAGEVLETGARALGLDAADEGGGELAREQRVLGEVLEVPPAERAALEVRARAENEAHALRERLPAKGRAYLKEQLLVPAAGGEHGGGEAGGGQGAVHAQHVARVLLFAQAVGAVGHHQRVQPQPGYGARVPAVRPLAELHELPGVKF